MRFRAALRVFLSSHLICRIIKKIKIFLHAFYAYFSRCIFSMRETRPARTGRPWARPDRARPALAYIKKHPAGSEPAGLYIINQGGFAGIIPPRGRCSPSVINMKKKYCGSRGKFFLCFISRFHNLLCVAVRVVSCCLCKGRWCRMVVIVPLLYI